MTDMTGRNTELRQFGSFMGRSLFIELDGPEDKRQYLFDCLEEWLDDALKDHHLFGHPPGRDALRTLRRHRMGLYEKKTPHEQT